MGETWASARAAGTGRSEDRARPALATDGAEPSLTDLIRLAQKRTQGGRAELGGRIAAFLVEGTALSAAERDLVDDILSQLIREIEQRVRADLAQALAEAPEAPPKLIRLLAADEIEIARPVLLSSAILEDKDLLDLVNRMTEAHREAIARRPGLSPDVSDALVEFGEEGVIEALLHNESAGLSEEALAYLVAESRRVTRFQTPLLGRRDLPPHLAFRMFWWVSAALRRHILTGFDLPAAVVDAALARAAQGLGDDMVFSRAAHVVRAAARGAGVGLHDMIEFLRQGRAALFIAAIAEVLSISADTARRLVLDPGGEGLALLCRAAGVPQPMFRRMLDALDENTNNVARAPEARAQLLATYDALATDRAQRAVRFFDTDGAARAA